MTIFNPVGFPPAAPFFVMQFVTQIASVLKLSPESVPDPVRRPMHIAFNFANYGYLTAVVIQFQGSGPWLTIMASGLDHNVDGRDIIVRHKLLRKGFQKDQVSALIDQLLNAIFAGQRKFDESFVNKVPAL